jgi:hypothetical protein
MSPRSLLNIILKVLGIYFIKEMLVMLPQLMTSIFYLSRGAGSEGWLLLFTTIITLAIYTLIIFYLLLDTDAVIDKLELTNGIEEENLAINVHRSTVLNIAIILIAIISILTVLPHFLQSIYNYVQQARMSAQYRGIDQSPDLSRVILYGIELTIAVLMIVYRRFFVNYIELARKK